MTYSSLQSLIRSRFTLLIAVVAIMATVFVLTRPNPPASLLAQTTPLPDSELVSLRASISTFFENLSDSNKGSRKALEDLMKNSPVSSDDKLIGELANLMKEINTRYGNYLSFEPIGVKSVGNDLIIVRYLYRCQNYPLVWYFTFYRNGSASDPAGTNSHWMLIGLRFESNLETLQRDNGF